MLPRWSILLLCGGLLLAGGALAYGAVPGEDYRVVVTPTDADTAENATSRDADVYAYRELPPNAQSVFREARATDGEAITVDAHRWPDEFEYGTDTEGHTVVTDGGTHYLVVASREQCLAALCDMLRALCGALALVGAALVSSGARRAIE
ncbi:hypothetical protein [Haloarcula onubensis]|uniref:DUF7979 domain-containing protein n=1 Tax=Haloarcula onubensis TaxID=2950539 RepID=A0ABU2FJI6_9EURY|nr:hypothetical protein [Halomicroarcula sp. S3CR25-11]MDS0280496.1 hypothetical protein [Halomicroarcula sp. S3CR25-11]